MIHILFLAKLFLNKTKVIMFSVSRKNERKTFIVNIAVSRVRFSQSEHMDQILKKAMTTRPSMYADML